MNLSAIMLQLVMGLASSMMLFLQASGLSLILSGLGVVNFGQGAFYVLGSFVCYAVTGQMGFWWALILTPLIVGAVGLICELAIRPLYGGDKLLYQLLMTIGISYIVTDLMTMLWGFDVYTVRKPSIFNGRLTFGSFFMPTYYVFIICVSLVIALAFLIMFKHTRLGMLIRATISNRRVAETLGVNVKRLFSVMFAIGVGLSGAAGALIAPTTGMSVSQSQSAMSSVLIVLVVGGIDNMSGSFFAALIIGIAQAMGALYFPTYSSLIPAVLMILVLIIRPRGLFSRG